MPMKLCSCDCIWKSARSHVPDRKGFHRLASKLTFVSASSGCTYAAATRLLSCNMGDVAVGAEGTTTIVAGYKGKGNVDHTVSVSTSTPDPVAANNSSVITTKLR